MIDLASDTRSIRLLPESLIQPEEFKNPMGPQWKNSTANPISYALLPWITINPGPIGVSVVVPRGLTTALFPAPTNVYFETQVQTLAFNNYGGIYVYDGTNYVEINNIGSGTVRAVASGAVTQTATTGSTAYLKLDKHGNLFTAYYRVLSSSAWIPLASFNMSFTQFRVGLGTAAYNQNLSDTSAQYRYFHVGPFPSNGSWNSAAIDLSSSPSTQGYISWEQDLPAGTSIQIQTSTSADGINWSAWSASYNNNFSSTISSPAARYIRVSAIFNSDGTSQATPILNGITIDYPKTSPSDPQLSSLTHPKGAWSNKPLLNLNWMQAQPNPAPETSYQYWLLDSLGNTPVAGSYFVPGSSAGQNHSLSLTLSAEGPYHFVLQAKGDSFSGSETSTAVAYDFNFDSTPPSATLISSSTHPELQFANSSSPVFSLSATDALSGVSGYAVALDSVSVADPGAAITQWSAELRYLNLGNGTYYLHARAVDRAGNLGAISHYGIKVDFNGALLSEGFVKTMPNPVRLDTAKIEYDLAAPASNVTLEFLSANGTMLSQADGGVARGKNHYLWDVSHVANGVYFCRIKANGAEDGKIYTVIKKIAIVR
jgi:hypothetical protein